MDINRKLLPAFPNSLKFGSMLPSRTQFTSLVNQLLPSQCLLCACTLNGELLCCGCENDMPYINGWSCKQCALHLTAAGDLCGHCLRQQPAFRQSVIPFAYDYPLDSIIHKFKYRQHLASGKLLGELLARHIKEFTQTAEWQRPDVIIPVPMHWMRRWQRGFNQAEILGQYVASELQLPLATYIVKRTQRTLAQKELSRNERQKNLRRAFTIPIKNHPFVAGKKIALIDDVVTTTATVRELSQLLKKAGAADIQVWALARTMDK